MNGKAPHPNPSRWRRGDRYRHRLELRLDFVLVLTSDAAPSSELPLAAPKFVAAPAFPRLEGDRMFWLVSDLSIWGIGGARDVAQSAPRVTGGSRRAPEARMEPGSGGMASGEAGGGLADRGEPNSGYSRSAAGTGAPICISAQVYHKQLFSDFMNSFLEMCILWVFEVCGLL